MSQHEQWDIVSGVGMTALGVAAARAVESSRPDRLVDDPYAAAFVRAAQLPIPMALQWPDGGVAVSDQDAILIHASIYLGLRSRFFDDYLLSACADRIGQVVILAAGLDARAFRLAWPPGLRLFEIDQPKVLEFKDAVLRDHGAPAQCARHVVAIDLREDWPSALRAAGFDPAVPTAWLAEGLLPYLSFDSEQELFSRINELSVAGSQLSVERIVDMAGMLDKGGLRDVRDASGFEMEQLVHTDVRPNPGDWLAERGWTVTDEPAVAVAERYHRNLTDPRLDHLPGTPLRVADYTAFLSAHRPR
jgi:methyltransferase (TIGR00027 family)